MEKKSLKTLMEKNAAFQGKSPGKFLSIKGGMTLLEVSTNDACTNSGVSCSGTNKGACTNGNDTDCSKSTNTGADNCAG